jgi:uncharacterized protein
MNLLYQVNPFEFKSDTGQSVRFLIATIIVTLLVIFNGCSPKKPASSTGLHSASPATAIIHFYRGPLNHLSSVKYGQCPKYPGCSEYALRAIDKHGTLIGWMMTFDRLIRCGRDEINLSPEVMVNGQWKIYDTVEQNDFWWALSDTDNKFKNAWQIKQSRDWEISIE